MVRNIAQFPVPLHPARSILPIPLLVVAAAVPAMAQDPPDTVDLGEVEVVVGSRAGITDPLTLPVPVDIYGAEEIARLGEVDLGEVLGRIAPSFNSARLSAGDGAALHVATLRGMNGDQVLVLINGRRPAPRRLRQGARSGGPGHDGHGSARHPGARDQADRGTARGGRLPVRLRCDRRRDQHRAQGSCQRGTSFVLPRPHLPG